jgi:prephenate dehydrogenase
VSDQASAHSDQRSVLVVGAGLIGTSIALALRARGNRVYLDDTNAEHLWHALRIGAGDRHQGETADVAVVAVPPREVATVVTRLLLDGIAETVTDTASIKVRPLQEISSSILETGYRPRDRMARFVGGHPLAGRERSGPRTARAGLFTGQPWVLTPGELASPTALQAAEWLVAECGAYAVVMTAEEHDRGIALTSHLAQLVASALAAELADQPDGVLKLVGQGFRDMTRIAASDPRLWGDIAAGNAGPLADAITAISASLSSVAADLRDSPDAAAAVRALVEAGRAGQRRIPGKHGGAPRSYRIVAVVVPDEPGQLARLLSDAAAAGVNVEDLRVDHAPGLPVGVIELFVGPEAAAGLRRALAGAGWSVAEDSEPA